MKIRESNYELLRIISMIFIIVWHLITHSGLEMNSTGSTNFFINLLMLLSIFHVSVFMLITGFYQSKSKFKLQKLLSLLIEIGFYNLIINTFFYVSGIVKYTNIDYLKSILFYNFNDLWYIQCYIIVYLLSPFLNRFIENTDRLVLKKLIIVLLLCFSIFPFLSSNLTFNTNGFSVYQYVMLYFIGAYIRKYNLNRDFLKYFNKSQKQLIYFSIFILSWLVNLMLYYFASYLTQLDSNILKFIGNNLVIYKYYYSNPLVIVQSISLFMLFGTFNFTNKFINYIASLVLGVYIIHETGVIKNNLYNWLNLNANIEFTKILITKIVMLTIIIFVVCIIIEIIRKLLFKLIYKIKTVRNMNKMIISFLNNVIDV